MSQLSKCLLTGDFRELPLGQETVCEFVRVRLVRAKSATAQQYRELRVRSKIVKGIANLYMERHVQDLGQRPRVLKLPKASGTTVVATEVTGNCGAEQIRAHIQARVDTEYPDAEFGSTDGAVPQQIMAMLRAQGGVQRRLGFRHEASYDAGSFL